MTFERFQNRVVIEARLIAVTPVFIGARTDSFKPGSISGSCVKDVYGRPYIPGSSLKGVLRACLSSVLNMPDDPTESVVNRAFIKKDQRGMYSSPKELADAVVKKSTLVEALFGSLVMAGKVKVADAILVADHVDMEVRNGVAIDRDTRTAFGGALFDTEVVPSGTAFSFTVSAENLEPDEAKYFGKLMEYFANGNITIGGRSRAGLGNVELRDVTVTIHRAVPDGFPRPDKRKCDTCKIEEAVANV